jgi:hypothetical protein
MRTPFFTMLVPAIAGGALVLVVPVTWFLPVLLGSIAIALLLGILSSMRSEESAPIKPGLRLFSCFVLGTTRPTAVIHPSLAFSGFIASACFVVGMVGSVMWLAYR